MSLAGTTTDVPLGAIIRGSGRSRSSSPGVESHPDYDRSRSADRGKGSSAPEQEVFVSVGNSTSSSSSPKLQPATITERLRQVVGAQCDGLPVLVGLVCGSLARKDCNPGILREELKPHLPPEAKTKDFEDFLAWLDQENKASPIPRPKDPRLQTAGVAFQEAEMVRLCALEKRPALNGCKAEVLRVNDPSQPGRIVVKLESGSQLAIRPENLQQIVAASPELPPKSPKSPKVSEKAEPANKAAGPDPAKSSVFGAAFAKLKAKAEAEARGELPERKKPREKEDLDKRGGIGSSLPAGQARRELVMGSSTTPTQSKDNKEVQEEEEPAKKRDPITFVAAEGRHEPPSRKVTVIDPRRPKRQLEEESDDEDVGIPGVVRPRCPPGTKENGGPPRQPTSPPQKAAKATPEPVCQMPAAPPRGLAKTVVPTSPVPSKTFASPLRRPNMPLQNMTLVVSDDAREADKAQKELAEKKRAMEDGKRQMLEKLTKQMQICLSKLQNPELDDKAKERYQDMITTLKNQMSKIGTV